MAAPRRIAAQPAAVFDAHLSPFVAGLGARLVQRRIDQPPIIGIKSCACAHLLVEQLGDDIERWKTLIQQFENLPGPVQKEFLERLSGFAERHLDEETRRAVSDTIREKISLAPEIRRHKLGTSRGHAHGTGERSDALRAGRRRYGGTRGCLGRAGNFPKRPKAKRSGLRSFARRPYGKSSTRVAGKTF